MKRLSFRSWLYPAALAGILALGFGIEPVSAIAAFVQKARTTRSRQVTGNQGVTIRPNSWKEVDRLTGEQKLEEASALVSKILASARLSGDEENWTRALVREVQLRTALHGYETAVRFLRSEPWPKSLLSRVTLQLFYAQGLVMYERAYSWEIGKRERVESKGEIDLKSWTKEQILTEAARAYVEAWKVRDALGKEPVARLSDFLQPNNYPDGIRGSLRDAVSYLFVELLADSSGWRPEQSNDLFQLDLEALLAGDPAVAHAVSLEDPAVHPLVRLGAILSDLEAWHAASGQREAVLEARLERLRRLHQSFSNAEDRLRIKKDLETRLPAFRELPWWSVGQAELAEFVRVETTADNLVRARAIALAGAKAYPDSPGGIRCRSIIESIEAPDYQLAAMANDGSRKRSIEVTHRNLAALTFRAYPIELEKRVSEAHDYNLFPAGPELQALLQTRPAAEWTQSLPATPDFKSHRTFVAPPLSARGFYVIVASARPDFGEKKNRILSVAMTISDLVLLMRQDESGALDLTALSGESGRALPGATVSLYRYDWQNGHRKVESRTADQNGTVRFEFVEGRSGASHFVLARHGEDVAIDPQYLSFWKRVEPGEVTASLLYTDRSVYRPLQKLFWKVVAYRGKAASGSYQTLPESPVTLWLVDPNGERVETRVTKTNAFGSASGEFTIPAGRLLGGWRIDSSLNGQALVRVEEYKRPTFEVQLKEPESALRLNRSAHLQGEARYYFGLPLVEAGVKWRVTRVPVYPSWSWWWRPAAGANAEQTIATGTTRMKEDGTFELSFTPKADERSPAAAGVSYRYQVHADVTDEGGETRSATRSFRLGLVAVEAFIRSDAGFVREEVAGELRLFRSDLDGTGRAGKGSWRLTRLQQPEHPSLPADRPMSPGEPNPDGAALSFRTEGDRLRPRWAPAEAAERILHDWPDGTEVTRGSVVHDSKGEAPVTLPKLSPGAYRLHYETTDDFGARFETAREIIVAGSRTPVALPALLAAEASSVPVGGTARILALSALSGQLMLLDIYRGGKLSERRRLVSGKDAELIEIPIGAGDRGGLGFTLTAVRDHQLLSFTQSIFVPWDDKELHLEFASFRDRVRPGAKESWSVTVKRSGTGETAIPAAELLAYMFDKSLDLFGPHQPPAISSLYPQRTATATIRATLGQAPSQWISDDDFAPVRSFPIFIADRLKFFDGYGIGGPGRREGGMAGGYARGVMSMAKALPASAPSEAQSLDAVSESKKESSLADKSVEGAVATPGGEVQLRSDFAETAFWQPHLLTDATGKATISFTVPDSVTAWNVWVHSLTRDLKGGSLQKESRSVKELMVRPYLPRFLREGDRADVKVVVDNASDRNLTGNVTFEILDPETNRSLSAEFGLGTGPVTRSFTAVAGKGTNLTLPIVAPKRVGTVAFKVTAVSGETSDGELRPLPILPSRVHLVQSRFVTLRNASRKELSFPELLLNDDPSRIDEQMVVTVDAQLFYSVLQALPYLVNYPYECTEQTLNRFISTGIVSSLYARYPAIGRMAETLSKRETRLQSWSAADPNRKMSLEETPWLTTARGGTDAGNRLTNVLDPRIARADRDVALAKLRKAQTSLGAFPWWPGGPPSPYMTLYILHGFAKAAEFGVDVPKEVVVKGWGYLASHYRDELRSLMAKDCCWEFLTFLNYVATCYPDPSWMGDALTEGERKEILAFSFKHWKQHSPFLKGYLSLTLKRMGRPADAQLVWASVMDSAKTTDDQGTFWAPEDRSWLWYNDTTETQAFALRTLMELSPQDSRKDGLVQWLLLDKKLNQWKSTRATAEVVYSLAHYLKKEGALGIREDATVTIGPRKTTFVFEPDVYSGGKNQIVVPGDKVDPKTMSTVVVEKTSKGFAFASATWHFSTEKSPAAAQGDFFDVSRSYWKREHAGREFTLRPLAEGEALHPGDEVEVRLTLRTKHAAEYVHLRDPRAAGFEPENAVSRVKWDLGIVWYEETRDSGTNFFFEQLPAGEYEFKYRLRVNMAGTFKVGPATVQSMYAPEFNAYSSGAVLTVSSDILK